MAHAVVHFEIMGGEGNVLQNYYRELFGWDINADNPMNYGVVKKEEPGIGGGVGPAMDGTSIVTVYVETDDLQATLDKAVAGGATAVMQPTAVPGGPEIAIFDDPAGNRVGLVKSDTM